ncbi:hypothetical protein BGZ59_000773 [Podila verticillata]|nr:hypothetical protein BGZ59_000773 [Podila verticillata]
MAILSLFSKKKSSSSEVASLSTQKKDKPRKIGDDGLPISQRTIIFEIDTGATLSDGTPVIYATPEAPAQVIASITFECDLDCMGDTFDVTFKAAAGVKVNDMITNDTADNQGNFDHRTGSIYEEVLQKKRWELPLPRLEGQPRVIPKGKYTQRIRVVLDPLLPSSSRHRRDWVEYQFVAQLTKIDPFSRSSSYTVQQTQQIWVLNSASFAAQLYQPLTVSAQGFKSSLPVSLSLPSYILTLGQTLPLTINVEPFVAGSKHAHKELVVMSAAFKLVETRQVKVKDSGNVSPIVEEIVSVPLVHTWPVLADRWSRTVNVVLPSSPELTPSTDAKVLRISHVLSVKLKVKAQGDRDRNAEEIKLQTDIKVGVPQPSGVFKLPQYNEGRVLAEKQRPISRRDLAFRLTLATVEATLHFWVLNAPSVGPAASPGDDLRARIQAEIARHTLDPIQCRGLGLSTASHDRVWALRRGSKYASKAPVVVSAVFKWVETRVITVIEDGKVANGHGGCHHLVDERLADGWAEVVLYDARDLTHVTGDQRDDHHTYTFGKAEREAQGEKDRNSSCRLFSKKESSSSSSPANVETRKLGPDGLPISKRTITIAVDTGATFGPDKIPLIYATPGAPAEVVATITFETDRDCTADTLDVRFMGISRGDRVNTFMSATVATVQGKQDHLNGSMYDDVFQKRHWQLPLPRAGNQSRVVPKGVYTQKVRVVLDSTLPSSSHDPARQSSMKSTHPHHHRGSIAYYFHAQLSKVDDNTKFTLASAEVIQPIWVLVVPALDPAALPPATVTEQGFGSALPVTLSIPSSVVALGQALPLTIEAGPFAAGSMNANKTPVVVSASFKLVETRKAKLIEERQVEKVRLDASRTTEIVSVPLVSAWPKMAEQSWSRTVNVTLPTSPELTPTTETKVLQVSHVVVVSVRVRAEGEKDRSAEEIRLQLEIKVVPQPTGVFVLPEYEGLPAYEGESSSALSEK